MRSRGRWADGGEEGDGVGAWCSHGSKSSAERGGGRLRSGAELPEVAAEPEAPAKGEVVALNIRLPKDLHRTLRRIAFDEETSINALLITAAERMLAERN